MGNKNSGGVKLKSAETKYNFNAVRKQPISDQPDAILPSASKQQQTLPKISLVNSITSETLFAGNGSIEEDVSSYKDAENEQPLVSECSDSVNAPELPLDSNTLDSFCMKMLPGDETTCSLSSDLDELTSECPSNGDTWTDYFARTHEIDVNEIKLLKNKQIKSQTPKLQSKEKLNVANLDYLALEMDTTKKFQGFSHLYTRRSLSTTTIEVKLQRQFKSLNFVSLSTKKQTIMRDIADKKQDNLEILDNFKGHDLIERLVGSIDDDHYLKLLISQNDLKQLMCHVAGYLLSIGVLIHGSRERDEKFMVDETYRWLQRQSKENNSGFVPIKDHLMAIEELKRKSDMEMRSLKTNYSHRVEELQEVIANLSK